ncbi:MAG: glycosyltransferase [Pseudomonadota bacterium]
MTDGTAGRGRSDIRRIIVDCTHIAPHPAHTGIPRVVEKYITYGRPAAARAGVELVLAECVGAALHAYEPDMVRARASRKRGLGAKIALESGRYATRILSALAQLSAALVPARRMRTAMASVAAACEEIVPALRRRTDHAPMLGTRLEVGPSDVVFCPGYWHELDMSAYEAAKARGADIVFLIHDILPITLPQHYVYPWRQEFADRLTRSFASVSHYYCISRQTCAEVKAFGAWQDIEVSASVAYNGFDPADAAAPPDTSVSPALDAVLARAPWLMVGTLEPKKGHADAIAVFEHLWSRGYERPLLIIGRRGWMSEPVRDAIARSPWKDRRLFWFEGLEDVDVNCAYSRAYGFLFPSLAEGFGLPILEAAGRGLLVLARDMPVAREILGEAALYFADRRDLAARLLELEAPAAHAAAASGQAGLAWYLWPSVVEAVVSDLLRPPGDRRADLMSALERVPVSAASEGMAARAGRQSA